MTRVFAPHERGAAHRKAPGAHRGGRTRPRLLASKLPSNCIVVCFYLVICLRPRHPRHETSAAAERTSLARATSSATTPRAIASLVAAAQICARVGGTGATARRYLAHG